MFTVADYVILMTFDSININNDVVLSIGTVSATLSFVLNIALM
jgi:hypothetical protein